jgi:hypothetical protein
MEWKREWKPLTIIIALFLACFYLPVGSIRFDNAIKEALYLTKWYAREHVLLCLIPAFFIAGAISVFVSQASVMKYLGAKANKVLAYGVASVSGTILAVCSCTVLPLFAGIYKMGAGLGPATAFLYSGPAINVLAIVLTARVLGLEIGIARAVGAISFSIIIGLLMHFIFRKEEAQRVNNQTALPPDIKSRPLWRTAVYFALLVGILIFANWGKGETQSGLYYLIYNIKWIITAVLSLLLGLVLIVWFKLNWWKLLLTVVPTVVLAVIFRDQPMIPFAAAVIGLSVITSTSQGESRDWFDATWGYTKQIMPLLLIGVLFSGAFLGRPGQEGLIPSSWVSASVGGNSVWANFFASIVGAFMYFATLTEVPILQGLIGSGMGKGPALALLLAGPALSLPSMLVLRSIMGTKKTVVYVVIVVIMATITGLLYGAIF